jgi:ribose transport system substrate-binding protein
LIRCDPGDDANLVLTCAERLATQQVDGWIVVQAGNLGEALCAAGPAGVPLIAVGGAPLPCETAWVSSDERSAGELVGTQLGKVVSARHDCARDTLVILGNSAAEPVSATRVGGIRAGFAAECPTATDPILLDAANSDRAYQTLRARIDALPPDEQMVIASVSDAAALGVTTLVPENRTDAITLAAIGGDERARCAIRDSPWWLGDAALFADRYGEVVVPALLDAIGGRAVPPAMYVTTSFLTAATAETLYPDDDCPAS